MRQSWVRIPPGGLITFSLITFSLITFKSYYLQAYYLQFVPVILSLRDGTEFYVRSGDHQSVANLEILSTMAGENFEIYMYEMARNAFKLSTLKPTENKIFIRQEKKNVGHL